MKILLDQVAYKSRVSLAIVLAPSDSICMLSEVVEKHEVAYRVVINMSSLFSNENTHDNVTCGYT